MCVIFITKPILSAKRLAYSTSTINGAHINGSFRLLQFFMHGIVIADWDDDADVE